MANIIDRILSEICLDERIPDGIFDMSNNTHMEVLREALTDTCGFALNDVVDIHNKMLEGKYPERQAYNKDGLLVTFPTPQHKQRAIQRGTHFEQNPVKGQQNVFGGGQQPPGTQPPQSPPPAPPAPAPATPAPAPASPAPASSQLPPSDQTPPAPAPAAPQSPSALPASDQMASSDKQTLAVEPASTPSAQAPAPPPNFETPKNVQQKAAEAQAVKQIMKGDDTNPTLLPSLDEQNLFELHESYNFAKRMGYQTAMKVILEAIRRR